MSQHDLSSIVAFSTAGISSHLEAASSEAASLEVAEDSNISEQELLWAQTIAERGILAIRDAHAELGEAEKKHVVIRAPSNQHAALLQSFFAEQAADGHIDVKESAGGLVKEVKFDNLDFGWVKVLLQWCKPWQSDAKWQAPPEEENFTDLDGDFRVAVVGDWGTNLYGAPVIGRTLAEQANHFDVGIHIGDIYYSGTAREVRERFLNVWPFRDKDVISRACNANHEMYSGGHGYFKTLLPEFGQSSSVYVLRNEHWLLIGLDSAYEDHAFAQNQDEWLERVAEAHPEHRIVLFTHHQPWSTDKFHSSLIDPLRPLLDEGRIFAWYWGHEHRCQIWERHPELGVHGRCVGHGGFPEFRKHLLGMHAHTEGKEVASGEQFKTNASVDPDHDWFIMDGKGGIPRSYLLDGPNRYVQDHAQAYGPHGYATLEFQGATLIERIHAPDGDVLYEDELS